MATIYNYSSSFLVNIIDVDTNCLIEEELYQDIQNPSAPSFYKFFGIIKGGTTLFDPGVEYTAGGAMPTYTLNLNADRLEALGYDAGSVTGNVITAFINPNNGLPKYPTIMNVYIRKR